MKKNFPFLLFLLLPFLMSCHSEGDGYMYELNNADKEFIHAIQNVSKHQLSLSTLALQQTANDSVKIFAEKMLDAHAQWLQQIDSLATSYNISLSDTLLPAHAALAQHLSNFNGYQFDTAYINLQAPEHHHAHGLIEKENGYGNAISVRDFAARKATELKEHLESLRLLKEHVF